MKNFQLFEGFALLHHDNGLTSQIHFTHDTGKVYYRYKIDTVLGVKHPGIFLGFDVNGIRYFIHNHFLNGQACVVTENEFAKGQSLGLYQEKCSNTPLQVVRLALVQVCRKEPYKFMTYNCQTFVNQACNNQRKSEDVDKWLGTIAVGAFAFILLGALFD